MARAIEGGAGRFPSDPIDVDGIESHEYPTLFDTHRSNRSADASPGTTTAIEMTEIQRRAAAIGPPAMALARERRLVKPHAANGVARCLELGQGLPVRRRFPAAEDDASTSRLTGDRNAR